MYWSSCFRCPPFLTIAHFVWYESCCVGSVVLCDRLIPPLLNSHPNRILHYCQHFPALILLKICVNFWMEYPPVVCHITIFEEQLEDTYLVQKGVTVQQVYGNSPRGYVLWQEFPNSLFSQKSYLVIIILLKYFTCLTTVIKTQWMIIILSAKKKIEIGN